MTMIRIELNNVKNINESLCGVARGVGYEVQSISSMRNSVSSQIQGRRNIQERINNVMKKMQNIENDIYALHRIVGYSTNAYTNLETELCKMCADKNFTIK